MAGPSINSLLEKVDSRFELCIIAGKRARQLVDGAQKLSSCKSNNAVTIATNEINENWITYAKLTK